MVVSVNSTIDRLWQHCVMKHTRDPMNWQAIANEFAELVALLCADWISDNVGYIDAAAKRDLINYLGITK